MQAFHSEDYVKHLKAEEPNLLSGNGIPEGIGQPAGQLGTQCMDSCMNDFKVGENDCPIFEGMFEFS